jgi:hypothetical protein
MKKNVTNLSGNLLKILSLTIVLAFIAPLMTNAQKANFAGTWTYSAEKSTQPTAPAGGGGGGGGQGGGGGRGGFGGGGNFVATQDANTLTRVSTRTGQDGTPVTTTLKYTLDGKECVNTNPRGDSKSVCTWSADGKTLTIVTTRDMNGTPMKTTEEWAITAPKTLSIVTSRAGQDGTIRKTTAVYEVK